MPCHPLLSCLLRSARTSCVIGGAIAGLLVGTAFGALPTQAQGAMIDQVWAQFGQVCGQVVQNREVNPAQFSQLQPEFRITRSTDGLRVFIDQQAPDGTGSLHISQSDVGGKRHLYCSVFAFSSSEIDHVSIASGLRSRLEASGSIEVAGGIEQLLSASPNWTSLGPGTGSIIIDAIGLLPPTDFLTQFDIHNQGIIISAIGSVPLEDVR